MYMRQQCSAVPIVGTRLKISSTDTNNHQRHQQLGYKCRTTKEGVYMYAQMPRSKWIEKCLGMVTLSGSAIWWTWETEDVFRRVRDGNKYAMKVHTPPFSC